MKTLNSKKRGTECMYVTIGEVYSSQRSWAKFTSPQPLTIMMTKKNPNRNLIETFFNTKTRLSCNNRCLKSQLQNLMRK